jgi:hypothetical protein
LSSFTTPSLRRRRKKSACSSISVLYTRGFKGGSCGRVKVVFRLGPFGGDGGLCAELNSVCAEVAPGVPARDPVPSFGANFIGEFCVLARLLLELVLAGVEGLAFPLPEESRVGLVIGLCKVSGGAGVTCAGRPCGVGDALALAFPLAGGLLSFGFPISFCFCNAMACGILCCRYLFDLVDLLERFVMISVED